jgi:endonuclease YncB( thermonuclease family)
VGVRSFLPESIGGSLVVVALFAAGVTAGGMKLAGSLVHGRAHATAPSPPADIVGRASVIDGDTIVIHGAHIRFYGIDAPESGQSCTDAGGRSYRCGQRAALALDNEIAGRAVSCDNRDVDRYGRIVAVCAAGGVELNRWMVAQGWAVAYRRYSSDYVPDEAAAKSAGRGIWAGRFEMPEAWRHAASARTAKAREQAATATDPRADCDIKGNISYKTGQRIYHLPGDRYYAATRINTNRGERWFCSEAEAQAAGWRHARR